MRAHTPLDREERQGGVTDASEDGESESISDASVGSEGPALAVHPVQDEGVVDETEEDVSRRQIQQQSLPGRGDDDALSLDQATDEDDVEAD